MPKKRGRTGDENVPGSAAKRHASDTRAAPEDVAAAGQQSGFAADDIIAQQVDAAARAVKSGDADALSNFPPSTLSGTLRDSRALVHLAAAAGHTNVLRVLVDAGVDVSQTTSDGRTAAHFAAGAGHSEFLLSLGRVPNLCADFFVIQCTKGRTPAHLAAMKGHVSAAIRSTHHISYLVRNAVNSSGAGWDLNHGVSTFV